MVKDVWMTGHILFVSRDGNTPENVQVLVLMDRQRFEFPPSRLHFKAIVDAEVMVDRQQSMIVSL